MAAGQDVPVGEGTVDLVVRGSDGQPLRRRAVIVQAAEKRAFQNTPLAKQIETDGDGKARFEWPAGLHRLRIVAPGVGYGATGWFDVRPGDTAGPPLPRLLPFGRIEGDIPKSSLRPNSYLTMKGGNFNFDREADRRIHCDEQGHFVIEDVPSGGHWFRPGSNTGRLAIETYVFMLPGQKRSHVAFRPDRTNYDQVIRMSGFATPAAATTAGTVRDEDGRPIAGAEVFVLATYHGGLRMYETVLTTKSDELGRWKLESSEPRVSFSGSIIAHKSGYGCSVTPLKVREGKSEQPVEAAADPGYELVLSRRRGTLEVTVVRDGKPLPNATVQITSQHGPGLYSPAYMGASREPAREGLAAILEPVAITDGRGVARFTDLMPGRYQLFATNADKSKLTGMRLRYFREDDYAYATADGVAVQAEKTTQFSLAVYSKVYQSRFRVLRPDGKPLTDRSVGIEWARVHQSGSSSSVQLDREGQAVHRFEGPGLWQLNFKYREPPEQTIPVSQAPYFETTAVVGQSLLLGSGPVMELRARRIEAGSILVELEDVDGKTVPGYVMLNRHYDVWAPYAGSTDDQGRIRFDGVQAWHHTIEAYSDAFPVPSIGFADEPFPTDTELVGRKMFVNQRIMTANDVVTPVKMRAVKVGYVRGIVRPPEGRTCADYTLPQRIEFRGPESRYNAVTGEFLCGPFPVGKTRIVINRVGQASSVAYIDQEVDVLHDRVTRLELQPPATLEPGDPQPGPQPAGVLRIGMGGISTLSTMNGPRGRATLSDGRTPAVGAHVYAFFPSIPSPTGHGMTDATGRFRMQGMAYSLNERGPDPPDSPNEPLLVAMLPGTCGVAAVPLKANEQTTIVLPPSIVARGKITVGAKAIADRKCQLRVYASYQGQGTLNDYFSLGTSADSDGNFTLAGLTPGTYVVQATLDDIWLSKSVTITVSADVPEMPPLELDVGEPGVSSVVQCVRKDGKPVGGIIATLERPAGPLAARLWPARLIADGTGRLLIPPLEAGDHPLRLEGQAKEVVLSIPPVADDPDTQYRLTIKLE